MNTIKRKNCHEDDHLKKSKIKKLNELGIEKKENLKYSENNFQFKNNGISSPRLVKKSFIFACDNNGNKNGDGMLNNVLEGNSNKESNGSSGLKNLNEKDFKLVYGNEKYESVSNNDKDMADDDDDKTESDDDVKILSSDGKSVSDDGDNSFSLDLEYFDNNVFQSKNYSSPNLHNTPFNLALCVENKGYKRVHKMINNVLEDNSNKESISFTSLKDFNKKECKLVYNNKKNEKVSSNDGSIESDDDDKTLSDDDRKPVFIDNEKSMSLTLKKSENNKKADKKINNILEGPSNKDSIGPNGLKDLSEEECNLICSEDDSVSDDDDKTTSDDDENTASDGDDKTASDDNNKTASDEDGKTASDDDGKTASNDDKNSVSIDNDESLSLHCHHKCGQCHNKKRDVSMTRNQSLHSDNSSETSENSENETEETKVKCLREIHKLLQEVKSNGEESIGDEATELPALPGLYIKNHGYVSLPLWGESAKKLIRVCTQAPYGLNDQTLIDTSVRDTYQINPDELEIRNLQWDISLKKLVKRVATGLGCTSRVEAKIYKLLLYKEGSHFKKHRDTEKEKQMFGTLVLQLPSVHEGGELVAYHKNGSTVYDFGQMTNRAPHHPHFVAHYADIEHEILPVKSGYRLALVYSLCWVEGNGDHDLKDQEKTLEKLSNCFAFFSECDDCYAIKLNHKYTASSLTKNGVKALKGSDNYRFNLLKNANSRLSPDKEMSFFIARVNLAIKSYDTVDGETPSQCEWEEVERKCEIDKWYSVSGKKYKLQDFSINLFTHVIDPDSKSRKPFANLEDERKWAKYDFEEDIEEYTGNVSATKTTTYHRYLLVFLPKKFEFSTFLKSKIDFAVSLLYNQYYLEEKADCATNLDALVNKITENYSNRNYFNKCLCDTDIHSIIEMCCNLTRFETLKSFLIYKKKISSDDMILIIRSFSWSLLQETLKDVLLPVTLQNIDYNCKLVQALIEMKDEKMAVECFMFCVDPILNESKKFMQASYGGLSCVSSWALGQLNGEIKSFFKLATTIKLLNQVIDTSELMSKFVKNMKMLDQKLLKKVLEQFIEMDSIESCSYLNDLFVFRSAYLSAKIEEAPKFNWSMPGSIPGHPKLDSFFRSDDQTFKYTGVFSGIPDARKFAKNIQKIISSPNSVRCMGYSATFVPNGIGKNAYVLITKTKDYFKSISAKYTDYRKEYDDINCCINHWK